MNRSLNINLIPFLKNTALKRGAIFGSILVTALLAFELFNFGTTSFALQDVLGDLKFAGMRWSAILAFAFCGIDFAGIARIFTPEQGRDEPAEVWYLFGAWLLAAAFNAMLTWWGVSVAILNQSLEGNTVVSQSTMIKIVPIFVAAMVWLIRVLIIGTFSVAGERLFTLADMHNRYPAQRTQASQPSAQPAYRPAQTANPAYARPAPKPAPVYNTNRPTAEPTYHPIGMTAMGHGDQGSSSVRR